MSKFSARQKQVINGIVVIEFIVGLALIVASVAGLSSIHIFIPLLLLVSATMLFVTVQRL
jgi:hypothetical protein